MISRDDANKKAIMCSNKSMCCEGLVKEIYDSIGTCGECKHYHPRRNNYDYCKVNYINFSNIDEETFFCADFKRI